MTLDGFTKQSELSCFLDAVPGTVAAFDVADVPPRLWPYLYLLDVDGPGLIVRLTGDRLRHTFGRDLRGVDLRRIIHGPDTHTVTAAYDGAIAERHRVAMRRTVHLRERNVTCRIECAFTPLIERDVVRQIVGCLFSDYITFSEGDTEETVIVTLAPPRENAVIG
ncbi:PAS domain-containing protein [Marivibrio halodurans]|uniref:PAS domain-containing protein n=2 Tax=Marivibrio halodurans TaxID=2039722 RepID=A0A8J7S109_9PROT|nr:PAS domain-containing protein [Marivibrio halodurans]